MHTTNTLEWNDAIGLYGRAGPGHTRAVAEASVVHSLPESFIAFAIDAQLGRLEPTRFESALEALAERQVRDPSNRLHGCLNWYYEEPHPIDTNASFFTGLTVLFIERTCASQLTARSRTLLAELFAGLYAWFKAELRDGPLHYPNKYLGDLVCTWLLAEIHDDAACLRALEPLCSEAIATWRREHWGWGEHLSQVYGSVMLTEISLLLMLQRQMSAELTHSLRAAAAELLRISDFFGEHAWTPSIRCYDFESAPSVPSYRTQVRRWDPIADARMLASLPTHRFMRACFGHFLHQADWHANFPLSGVPQDGVLRIPCAFGAHAEIRKRGPWRIGALTRFPLSTDWDCHEWGLSWQSFPATFAHDAGLWGFAQWRVVWADGSVRAHPAIRKHAAYLNNALVPDGDAFTGSTRAQAIDTNCLTIERQMPRGHSQWAMLHDQWSIFLPHDFGVEVIQPDGWFGLRISPPEISNSVSCRSSARSLDLLLRADAGIAQPSFTRDAERLTYACALPATGESARPILTWRVTLND